MYSPFQVHIYHIMQSFCVLKVQ